MVDGGACGLQRCQQVASVFLDDPISTRMRSLGKCRTPDSPTCRGPGNLKLAFSDTPPRVLDRPIVHTRTERTALNNPFRDAARNSVSSSP